MKYRIEFSVQQKRDEGFDPAFVEIGVGASSAWSDLAAVLEATQNMLRTRNWETVPGMPRPQDIVDGQHDPVTDPDPVTDHFIRRIKALELRIIRLQDALGEYAEHASLSHDLFQDISEGLLCPGDMPYWDQRSSKG